MEKSRLDQLWEKFKGVSIQDTPSEIPSDKVILSESAIRQLITASQYGMVRLEYIQSPTNPDAMQIVGYDSIGQIITSVDVDKSITDIKYKLITQVDIDNGVQADLNTPALELVFIGKTKIIPLIGTALKGSTTSTIQTDIVSNTIKSNLLIDSGNNNISSVQLKAGNNGVYSKLNIDNSSSITLKETNDGLSAVLHLVNSNEELKFESITWEEYNALENKVTNTVYLISNKSAIYFNGQEYSIQIDQEVFDSKFEEIRQELQQIIENISGGLKSVTLNENELIFVYTTTEGDSTISINLSKYIDVYTPGNGISITRNEISIDDAVTNKIDNTSNTVTQIQEDIQNIQNDITNVSQKIQENTYNKTEVDSLISAIDDKLEGIDMASYETIEGAASKYQPKGNYLTEHQDISGLATKQEVADAVTGVDVTEQLKDYAKKSELPSVDGLISKDEADATYQPIGDYITEHQDISNLATKTEVAGKVDKVSGKRLSTNDYTNADKAKVDAMSSVPQGGSAGQILSWKSNGKAKWDNITNVLPGLEEILGYGVEWDINVADPHLTRIGNMSLHKTLPIQSQLKGCIAQAGKIIYWLDEKDWRRKIPTERDVVQSSNYKANNNSVLEFLVRSPYSINVGQQLLFWNEDESYIKSEESEYQESFAIFEVTSASNSADGYRYIEGVWKKGDPAYGTIFGEDGFGLSGISIEIGSNLSGYDGTVRVYSPNFYIKSQIIGNKRRVWISSVRIDDTWTYQPELLIDAYRSTVLNTVPENMGYLSTLPVNSAISVVNTATYCRGGNNDTAYDKYLETDPHRTQLGKPRTGIQRSSMRTYARNARSEMLSYDQYKNIFYWLYVIEYANFDCQEEYSEVLTTNGYHLGGMGEGVTEWNNTEWFRYNGRYPLTPCGYANEFGNKTGIKSFTTVAGTNDLDTGIYVTSAVTSIVPRWRGFENLFGDIWTNLDGILIDTYADYNPNNMNYVYTCKDPTKYADDLNGDGYEKVGEEIHQIGYTKLFDLGNAAHIIPKVTEGNFDIYKCDYHWIGDKDSILKTLVVGGCARFERVNGLGGFNSGCNVQDFQTDIGFRSVSSKEA